MPPSGHDPSVPLRWQPTPDGRSRGTFTQFVRDYLSRRPQGAPREEIIEAAQAAAVARQPRSRRGTLEAIARLRRTGELKEVEGRLVAGRQRIAGQRRKRR